MELISDCFRASLTSLWSSFRIRSNIFAPMCSDCNRHTRIHRATHIVKCICTYRHIMYVHTYVHTYIRTYILNTYIRTYICIYRHIHTKYIRTYIHTYVHTYVRTYILNTYVRMHMHAIYCASTYLKQAEVFVYVIRQVDYCAITQ